MWLCRRIFQAAERCRHRRPCARRQRRRTGAWAGGRVCDRLRGFDRRATGTAAQVAAIVRKFQAAVCLSATLGVVPLPRATRGGRHHRIKEWAYVRRKMLRKLACAGRFNGTALLLKRAWSTSRLSGIWEALEISIVACPFRKTGFHFSGTALKSEEYPMRQWLIMLGPALALMGLQTSHAQVTVDIRKITCNEFLSGQLTELEKPRHLAQRLLERRAWQHAH